MHSFNQRSHTGRHTVLLSLSSQCASKLGPSRHYNDKLKSTSTTNRSASISLLSPIVEEREIKGRGARIIVGFELWITVTGHFLGYSWLIELKKLKWETRLLLFSSVLLYMRSKDVQANSEVWLVEIKCSILIFSLSNLLYSVDK